MNSVELKNNIQHFLETADNKILKIVNDVFEDYYQGEVVAFYPNGKPMTKKIYESAINIANEQVKKEEFISVEEFENG